MHQEYTPVLTDLPLVTMQMPTVASELQLILEGIKLIWNNKFDEVPFFVFVYTVNFSDRSIFFPGRGLLCS